MTPINQVTLLVPTRELSNNPLVPTSIFSFVASSASLFSSTPYLVLVDAELPGVGVDGEGEVEARVRRQRVAVLAGQVRQVGLIGRNVLFDAPELDRASQGGKESGDCNALPGANKTTRSNEVGRRNCYRILTRVEASLTNLERSDLLL